MDPAADCLEGRLNSFMEGIQFESRVFEELLYKNKNQHRRCSYYNRLLKVRGELRLLQSIQLEHILSCCFQVISGKKPKQKLYLLECLKSNTSESGTPNFMQRLLGAARLLSEMVEPIIKAAIEVSILLARSFFMGFCLTILSLLSRIRVLVQQMLLDVVKVFNNVQAISQQKQAIKITESGEEIFREYYPTNKFFITLDCIWSTDKYILIEQMHETAEETNENNDEICSTSRPTPRYQTIEAFLEDSNDSDDDTKMGVEDDQEMELEGGNCMSDDVAGCSNTPTHSTEQRLENSHISNSEPETNIGKMGCTSLKRPSPFAPAFVSVKRQATLSSKAQNLQSLEGGGKEDSFFKMLNEGNQDNSSF